MVVLLILSNKALLLEKLPAALYAWNAAFVAHAILPVHETVDALRYPLVDPQLFWQCYDEIHWRMKNWRQFVFLR